MVEGDLLFPVWAHQLSTPLCACVLCVVWCGTAGSHRCVPIKWQLWLPSALAVQYVLMAMLGDSMTFVMQTILQSINFKRHN